MANDDTAHLLPPLPALRPHCPAASSSATREAAPSSPVVANIAESSEAANAQSMPAPELRPVRSSYRNSAKHARSSAKENVGARGSSPQPKGSRLSAASSMSSRPTTAGAESASTYSTSWRDEWTPGNAAPLDKTHTVMLPPAPAGSRPPPLPPLPARPPESGSVLQAPAGGARASQPAGTAQGDAEVVDEVALRRISMSGNAKAATPPPLAGRRSPDSPVSAAANGREKQAGSAAESAAKSDAEGAAADSGLDETLESAQGADFSDLARSFASLDVF